MWTKIRKVDGTAYDNKEATYLWEGDLEFYTGAHTKIAVDNTFYKVTEAYLVLGTCDPADSTIKTALEASTHQVIFVQ